VPGVKQLQLKKGNSSFSNQPGSSSKLQRKGSILGIKHQNSLADNLGSVSSSPGKVSPSIKASKTLT